VCAKIAQWSLIQKRYDDINNQLMASTLESSKRQTLQKEFAHLDHLLKKNAQIQVIQQQIDEMKHQSETTSDADMIALFKEEIENLSKELEQAHRDLDFMIAPPDDMDQRSVFLEIRAGAGGQESALFASDLLKMYTNYALRKNWRVSIESQSLTDLGGFREVVIYIQGDDVFGHLKYESGVHRVQRIPATETQGRVHTSTATVAVLPEAKEVDVTIDPSDLRIDVYRASGAGGQHVNTTDSAVRITHLPTNVVVSCQDERSQHKNKAKAMKMLQSRLLAAQLEKQQAEMSQMRKSQVGTGMRAEKVRTYNFPQNRVTDHQVDVTLKNLDMVIEGNMDGLIDPLRSQERELRTKEFLAQFN
jgi:peptide chain release factor 1